MNMKSKLLFLITVITLLLFPKASFGQVAQAPNLGSTSSFALFTADGAFNSLGATTVRGDVGTNAGAFTGLTDASVDGQIHVADPVSAQAKIDVLAAYGQLDQTGAPLGISIVDGQVIKKGVWNTGAASTLNGTVTLDAEGDPDAIFIIRIGGAFSTGLNSNIVLIDSASWKNVYWRIEGAFELGDGSVFRGTIINVGQIELLEGSKLFGRALSTAGAVLLHNNEVSIPFTAAPTVTLTQPTCAVATGTITVTAPLGAGITYSIGGAYKADLTFSGLVSGQYTVTADSAGVISSGTVVTILSQPLTPGIPTANLTQPTCALATGTITILSPIGGMTYSIGGAFQSGLIFSGLLSGPYTITAMNADGCTSSSIVTILAQPPTPDATMASVIQPNCSVATGTITVTSPTGAGITYSIGGAYQASAVFSGVLPGSYIVTAINSAGCISLGVNVTVLSQPPTPAAPVASVIQPDCSVATGTITVTSPTGAGITYSIGGAYQANPIFNGVLPGLYNVTAKNTAGGCISSGTNVTILAQPTTPSAPTATTIQPNCSVATGTITVTSPTGAGITYSIGGAYQASPIFSGVLPGLYNVTAKNTAGGCISSGTNVTILAQPTTLAAPMATTIQPNCSVATGTITVTSPTGAGITLATGAAGVGGCDSTVTFVPEEIQPPTVFIAVTLYSPGSTPLKTALAW